MYIIIGASGFLGRYCIKNVLEKTSEDIIATYSTSLPREGDNPRVRWEPLDITDFPEIESFGKSVGGDAKIIFLAAFHHPDKVEEFQEHAWNVNIVALANAVNAFSRAGCLYYASTDAVYGEGSKERKFRETDCCAPINMYGRQKALAEQITLARGFNVVRFPFIFGPSLVPGRPSFFDRIKADLEAGKTVEMFQDASRSTLSFDQCAGFLVDVMETHDTGGGRIMNIAADEGLSKYEVALALAGKYGLDSGLVKPISVRSANGIFKTKRAETLILDNTLLKKTLNLDSIHLEL